MEEYKTYTLEEISKGKGSYGIAASAVPFDSSLYTYLRITDINDDGSLNKTGLTSVDEDNAGNYLLKPNDIVFARTGNSTGRAYFYDGSDGELVYAGFLIKFSLDEEKVNPRILKYYTHSKPYYDWVRSFDTGGTRGNINAKTYAAMPIVLPPRNIQDQIVSLLKSLDDKIELNRRVNENLEQQAQALFKSWFVDFEPFKDGEFVESELGRIPKGWRVYSMNEIVEVIGGYSYKGSELQESTTAMATIKNFERKGGFKIDGFKEIIPSLKAKEEQFLHKFDVLIAHTDLTQNADIIGNPALLLHFGKYERLIMSMDLVKAKSKAESLTNGLLYSIFADCRFKSHALGYVNGTTVLHLSKKAIPEYKLALPCNLTIIKPYGELLNSLFTKEAEILEENDRLATLRDTLLPKLMSGELKVNEVEI